MIKRKFPFYEMKCVTQIVLCLTLLLTLQTYASVGIKNIPNQEYWIFFQFDFEVQRKLNCHDDYRAKNGDILSVFYESFSKVLYFEYFESSNFKSAS